MAVTTENAKAEDYRKLVARRKACRLCAGVQNPSVIDGGIYDTDEIGHWSKWQGDLDARILVVGQDWGDVGGLRRYKGDEQRNNETNRNLVRLLRTVGFPICIPEENAPVPGVFLTNAMLCCKESVGLQGEVQDEWFSACGKAFLVELVSLIKPEVVVALGRQAFRAVLLAYGLPVPKLEPYRPVVEALNVVLPDGPRLVPVYHCGAGITRRTRSMEQQERDWERVWNALSD